MVGGRMPSRTACTQKIASNAPVAPIMCPVMDLVDEMGIAYAFSAKAALMARVSDWSFKVVPVPCALMLILLRHFHGAQLREMRPRWHHSLQVLLKYWRRALLHEIRFPK